jgi:hypothetical protein
LAKHSPFSARREVPFITDEPDSGLPTALWYGRGTLPGPSTACSHDVSRAFRNGCVTVSSLDNGGPLHQHMQVHMQRAIPRARPRPARAIRLPGTASAHAEQYSLSIRNTAETPNLPMVPEDHNSGDGGNRTAIWKKIYKFQRGHDQKAAFRSQIEL